MQNVNIHGSKNAALPILAGTLLEKKLYYLKNIPLIGDIYTQLAILKQFNVTINWLNQADILIDTRHLTIPPTINYDVNCRGTYYFMGAIAAYNIDLQFTIANGCEIDNRKYDYHITLLELLGKEVTLHAGNKITVAGNINWAAKHLIHTFPKPSVGATINALFMFGKSTVPVTLYNCAKDPYILDTIRFMQTIGFNITYGEDKIELHGYQKTSNPTVQHTVIDDTIEALTYIIYSGINLNANSTSSYTIGPFTIGYLGKTYALLQSIGIELLESKTKNYYYIYRTSTLKPFNITTGYYPDIYTDIQPFLCLLALYIDSSTVTNSSITEIIWNDRFKYIEELNKLGCMITSIKNCITIPALHTTNTPSFADLTFTCPDLRGGMAVYLLMRKYNILHTPLNKDYIDRGYTDYENNINIILHNDSTSLYYHTKQLSNIKIGGLTKYYAQVYEVEHIISCINYCNNNKLKYKVIGGGNNIYFADYYDGMLIHNEINHVQKIDETNNFIVSAGTLLLDFIFIAAEHGVDLSALAGIPGTVGGALYGNAGAYGTTMSDIVEECTVLRDNQIIILNKRELELTYRSSIFKQGNNTDIILSCKIGVNAISLNAISLNAIDTIYPIHDNIVTILTKRNQRIPNENTLGSVFKNIVKNGNTQYMWQLIDGLALRGKFLHNIKIHDTHPNIFINAGNATCSDMDKTLDYIEELIYTTHNITCEREIECIR